MNSKYFGDRLDIYKYSIIKTLLHGNNNIHFIDCLMWTENQQQQVTNNDLINGHIGPILALRTADLGVVQAIGYRREFFDLGDRYNSFQSRDEFSQALNERRVPPGLVFFDPDTGIEPRGGAGPQHIEYDVIRNAYTHGCSVLVYQHADRNTNAVDEKVDGLRRSCPDSIIHHFKFSSAGMFFIIPPEHQIHFNEGLNALVELEVFSNRIDIQPFPNVR